MRYIKGKIKPQMLVLQYLCQCNPRANPVKGTMTATVAEYSLIRTAVHTGYNGNTSWIPLIQTMVHNFTLIKQMSCYCEIQLTLESLLHFVCRNNPGCLGGSSRFLFSFASLSDLLPRESNFPSFSFFSFSSFDFS